ncbi:hypothetical protein AAY84_10550 [Serratia marcescens]|uniref:hypothetical protein n=1 Tax=Serratia TaxID=613 RepID=UPI00062CA3DD|nr:MULTISPECIES: hypothetical protein [Serratia]KKZ18244.1 hypothetical protein AAY84_10550 [Serratia marcescens]MBH2928080.1 hypothetical protein [Serratia ureilytica]
MFDNEKAYQLTLEYMRSNHMKASRHAEYFRIFLEAYDKFSELMTTRGVSEPVLKSVNVPGHLIKKV